MKHIYAQYFKKAQLPVLGFYLYELSRIGNPGGK